MCRLTAYAGPQIPLDRLVFGGEHSLERQAYAPREMRTGTVNVDGYGIAWFPGVHPVRLAEARPIWHDPDLRPLLESISRPLGLAALRSATPGLPIDRSAVAPFLYQRWAFALNGFIAGFRNTAMRKMRADLPDHLYSALTGVSDTETIFLTAVAELERGLGPADALRHAYRSSIELASSAGVDAPLNLVLADAQSVTLTRGSNGVEPNSLYWTADSELTPGGTLVASEPLTPGEAWTSVPAGHLITISPGADPVIEPI